MWCCNTMLRAGTENRIQWLQSWTEYWNWIWQLTIVLTCGDCPGKSFKGTIHPKISLSLVVVSSAEAIRYLSLRRLQRSHSRHFDVRLFSGQIEKNYNAALNAVRTTEEFSSSPAALRGIFSDICLKTSASTRLETTRGSSGKKIGENLDELPLYRTAFMLIFRFIFFICVITWRHLLALMSSNKI